jgi:hypothetical protein
MTMDAEITCELALTQSQESFHVSTLKLDFRVSVCKA